MGFWQALFEAPVAQVLLTHDDLRNRRRYLNARTALQELLRLGALPIVNENDTVAVDELKLGDNDNLAAAVASLVEADLLLIATDIAGLYSGHPLHDPAARPIERIASVTPDVLAMAGGAGSARHRRHAHQAGSGVEGVGGRHRHRAVLRTRCGDGRCARRKACLHGTLHRRARQPDQRTQAVAAACADVGRDRGR